MKFNIFKTFKLTWWQAALFKVSVISVGILLALYFTQFFQSLMPLFWISAIVPGLFILYVWLKQ